jgi:coenzyme F420-0:L-glutamate ligase/coenzyme F420-1:gamma-L-glutamate ligase
LLSRGSIWLCPLEGLPLVEAGDDVAGLILDAVARAKLSLQVGDVIVIAQKVISKAEGRLVDLSTVQPSEQAVELGRASDKDPRLVELILQESREVLRVRPGVIIVEHRLGLILANAGIDRSNVKPQHALLLPLDPDRTCTKLRSEIAARTEGIGVGVMIIDSIGRAWRNGTVGTTIGASGVPTLLDLRGRPDLFGRPLETTELGWADELAAAASLTMGQADESRPVVLVRGLAPLRQPGATRDLLRPREKDLFR